MNLKCSLCGIEYQGRARWKRNFCGNTCRIIARRSAIETTCKHCGAITKKRPSNVKKNTFCSHACFIKNKINRVTKMCLVCSDEFLSPDKRPRKYCSKKCYGLANRNSAHYLWKPSVTYRTVHHWITNRLGKAHMCKHCGIDTLPEGKKRYFDWANISREYKREESDWIMLCKKCHRAFDSKKNKHILS